MYVKQASFSSVTNRSNNETYVFFERVLKMLKKVLLMIVVLSMVQLASASVFLSVDGSTQAADDITVAVGGSITVYVVDTVAGIDTGWYWDMLKSEPATMAEPTASQGFIAPATLDLSTGSLYDFGLTAAMGTGFPAPGEQFSAVFTATGTSGQTFTMDLLEGGSPYGIIDRLQVEIIPEPATMALLGLGGLLLRRRKKA